MKKGYREMKAFIALFFIYFLVAPTSYCQKKVITGDEIFIEKYLSLIKGKNVGIITNQSGILQNGKYIIDLLADLPDVKVVAIFAPEHGIRGETSAGKTVSDSIDEKTGIPIFSLYGKTTKPTTEMLKGIDVLIYDIQDVGARFYTYMSTLDLTMEAAAENGIKYIVLDRPDMLRADLVDGPVLEDSLRSFVGIQPIPSVYGMTPGEFASMINDERMLEGGAKADLTVIKMRQYTRDIWYDQTALKWITPSPNLPDMNSVIVYPGNVLIEGTNVSEGRGTNHPFANIGAPFIDSRKLIDLLDQQHIAGVRFYPIEFTPKPYPWAAKPKYNGELCHGVKITVANRNVFRPVEMGVTLVWAIHELYPNDFRFDNTDFDRLCGTRKVRLQIIAGNSPKDIFVEWYNGINEFQKVRKKYLLYK
jgi:uncharacterized protein YbbC (DUF1343 family)